MNKHAKIFITGLLNRAGWTASTGFEQGLGVAYAEFVATNAF